MKKFLALILLLLAAPGHPLLAAESCVTSSCHQGISAIKNPHQPVKDGDCASCHIQKLKEHPVKSGKSFELAAKGAELCSLCHSPLGKKKYVHSPVKEGDCTGCHKPHGASGSALLDGGSDRTGLCLGCHDPEEFRRKLVHGPVAVGACTVCHDPHESAEKGLLKASSRDLCLKCHIDFGEPLLKAPVVHPPVKKGCSSCHDPHSSEGIALLKKKMPDICLDCHTAFAKKQEAVKVPHKPLLSEKGCGACHSTHYSQAKGLLPTDEKTLCLGCHGTNTLGKPPLANIKKEIEGKKFLHGPIAKGLCTPCHDPHGSPSPKLLTGKYPGTLYASYADGAYDFCLKCHDKNLLRFPETSIYTKFRNGKKNLHYVHVVGRKGRTCLICHAPHAADGPFLTRSDGARFGDWKIPLNFVKAEDGGTCTPGCHRTYSYGRMKPQQW